ncbi:hypothetical protein E6O75_ATG01248 [Venturia nashicola]|uniref:C2H2-type domain-containing protein n=1 Tax=Venturia nashicola TaxID=86259 RepID=A0A4Z1PRJ5_9PEZI|nr:hypothetical protein E6O75_ATG01248 [Venturia nashicola]
MASQVLTEPFAASISLGGTSQPQTAFPLRCSRSRKIPSPPSTKKLSQSQRDTVSHNNFGHTLKFEHYSRAEHLRRHQQNHETYLSCHFASCGKTFHRQDLLDRHLATKHNQQPDYPPRRLSQASCSSSCTQSGSIDSVIVSVAPIQAPSTAEILPYISEISDTFNPSRYNQVFYNQPSYCPISYSSFSSSDVTYTNMESHAEFVKPEHSIPPVSGWHQPSPSFDLAFDSIPPFQASDGHSPVAAYPALDPWATVPVPNHYPYQNDLDQLSLPYMHTDISSPCTNSTTHMATMLTSMDQEAFTKSGASSPTSVASSALPPAIIPQDSKSMPYPLVFPVQRDKYGSLNLEVPLEDQQLGISLSLKTKQHYIESYWKYFHPVFPVLHRPSYQAQTPCPLLSAAVISIGAQYNDGHSAQGDSRILHEKCQELISEYRSFLRLTDRLDYMQAVFLVEMFSHFKAKRATSQLSEMFNDTYSQLGKQHISTPRPHLEALATIKPYTTEDSIKHQWLEWIHLHSIERLLAACYILDTQQALLLARPALTDTSFGLDLYLPANSTLWEAPVHTSWANLLRSGPASLVDVISLLDSIAQSNSQTKRCEAFQSALLTACHTSSVLTQRLETDNVIYGPVSASHPIFETSNMALLEQALCPESNVLIAHNMVRLAAHSPTRALLAVSGDSWVFSQRLSSEALLAASEFETFKSQLRSWSETLQQPTLWPTNTGATIRSDACEALHRALAIIRLALDMDSRNLSFGTKMAVYYSSLVLWAITFGAVCKAESAELKFEDDDSAELAAPRAEEDARVFVELAEGIVDSTAMMTGGVFGVVPPVESVDRWRFGVGAVLAWGAWVIGGGGAGELVEGAVGVLERLGKRGRV